jgi:hypothetical protein
MRELLEIVGSKRLEEVQLTCTHTVHTFPNTAQENCCTRRE